LVITQVSAHFSEKATIMRQRAIVEIHAMSTHANTLYVTKKGNPEFDLGYRSPEMSYFKRLFSAKKHLYLREFLRKIGEN